MKISQRIQNITPSATLGLNAKVGEMRAKGIDVISFSVGEPDFGTPKNICDAACKAIQDQHTKYTAVAGIAELRRAVCKKLREENGLSYTPEQISVGVGAKQPLYNTFAALCDEGDEVIVPTPCWVSYVELIKLAGAKAVLVEMPEENGFQLDIAAIEKAITPRTVAILINTPNNPTGAVYTEEGLRALADVALRHDLMVIADEIYEKLIYNGKKHFSIGSVSPEMLEHTVTINGVSKAYAMTGWRLGYAAGPLAVIKGMNAMQGHSTGNTCSIAQYAALEALSGPQESVEEMRLEFNRRRQYLVERLREIPGITCTDADGAFYLMPNVSAFYGKKTPEGKVIADSFDMSDYLLTAAHIALVPGDAFASPANVRISYATAYDLIVEGANRMEKALSALR